MAMPLCFDLCRPYFDLAAPSPHAPLHVHEPMLYLGWMESGSSHRLGTNMAMTPVFRQILIQESGLSRYAADTPLELAPELRSPSWQLLCERLLAWEKLDSTGRLGVARVLIGLTYHQAALRWLRPLPADTEVSASPTAASLAFLAAYASFLTRRGLTQLPEELLLVARLAPEGSLARLQAGMTAAHICLDYLRQPGLATPWIERTSAELGAVCSGLEPDDAQRLRIRFHALRARYHEAHKAPERAEQELLAAEALVGQLPAQTDEQRLLRREAMRRLLDQRSMVARNRGDLAMATEVARQALAHDPNDAKAHWLLAELRFMSGEFREALVLYRRAARLGPLGTARSWFMAGQCHERLEAFDEAIDCYLSAVRLDPLSPSPLEALQDCARRSGLPSVEAWARRALQDLHRGPGG